MKYKYHFRYRFSKNLSVFFFLSAIFLAPNVAFSQNSDEAAMFQKYWQYRKRFNRHFIVQDKEPSGCVNDGIGFNEAGANTTFAKAGYGIPATQLYIAPNGSGSPGAGPNSHGYVQGISWGNYSDHEYNFLTYSSETLTELGHNFVMLATEYKLLGESEQYEEQSKVLGEIFLGLQAVRRLDMQAQFFIDNMYDDRIIGNQDVCNKSFFDECKVPYDKSAHKHWDSKVTSNNFDPDYSGYAGFPIREDADQNIKTLLTDLSDDSWNVDAIGGGFTVLHYKDLNNPEEPPIDADHDADPFAELVNGQMFISQDQITNLFYGFIFLKEFIPPTSSVTTCNGDSYYPIDIMEKITSGIVDNFVGNRIVLPGSKKNCKKPIKLSDSEGGYLAGTLYGIQKMANKILGQDKYNPSFFKKLKFYSLSNHNFSNHSGQYFFTKSILAFEDFSKFRKRNKKHLYKLIARTKWEILLLGNDVLYPSGVDAVGPPFFINKEWFKGLLVDAPCGGPCFINKGYNKAPNFICSNTPNWGGNRWSGYNHKKLDSEGHPAGWQTATRSNGLDYLTLHNLYRLKYGANKDFYNPESFTIDQPINLYGNNSISGPSSLQCNESGEYKNVNWYAQSDPQEFIWNSINMNLSSTTNPLTYATMGLDGTSGVIGLTQKLNIGIPSYDAIVGTYNKHWDYKVADNDILDECISNAHKMVTSEGQYSIFINDWNPCNDFSIGIVGYLGFYNPAGTWRIERQDAKFITGNINYAEIVVEQQFTAKYGPTNDAQYLGPYTIIFYLDDCSIPLIKTYTRDQCKHDDSSCDKLNIIPNPANDFITIHVSHKKTNGTWNECLIPSKGITYTINHASDMSHILKSGTIFSSSDPIDISNIPNGSYIVSTRVNQRPISKTIIISKK